jgi:hypothetical protein
MPPYEQGPQSAFLVENPEGTSPNVVAAEDGTPDSNPSTSHAPGDLALGTLHAEDPYAEFDRTAAAERHALDLQFQGMTKGYEEADGTNLIEVDREMERVHQTYASCNAVGESSTSLKESIARHDAEVKARIERHAGGQPLLKTADNSNRKETEADALLRRMAELDAATRRAVAENDKRTLGEF